VQIQEVVRQGNLKLHELEEDWVQLRKKSMLMDAEIKKLENKITQECCVDKLRMIGQDMGSHTIALEDCRQEIVTLLPWLQPHLTRQSN